MPGTARPDRRGGLVDSGASTDDTLAAALAAAGLSDTQPGRTVAGGALVVPEPADEEPAPAPARWPDGAATGVGSMPGTDPGEAAAVVVGSCRCCPLAARAAGAGVGAVPDRRTAALLVDIHTEVWPSGYRVAARPGRDDRRGRDLVQFDVDAFEAACDSARPGWVKVQAAGPWTLAAGVELHTGNRVLTDRGAVREFAASLTEGLRAHVSKPAARTGAGGAAAAGEPCCRRCSTAGCPPRPGSGPCPRCPSPMWRTCCAR